jgi:hypothetical protein
VTSGAAIYQAALAPGGRAGAPNETPTHSPSGRGQRISEPHRAQPLRSSINHCRARHVSGSRPQGCSLTAGKSPALGADAGLGGRHLPLPYVSRTNLDAAVANLDAKALRPKLLRFDFTLLDQLATEFST